MSPLLRGFVDAFRRPGALALLAAAQLFAVLLPRAAGRLALAVPTSARGLLLGGALVAAAALLGRAVRNCVLAGVLPRVVRGGSTRAGAAIVRGLRLLGLELAAGGMAAALALVALLVGVAAIERGSAGIFALGVAPLAFAALIAWATLSLAALEVALLGARPRAAIGRAFVALVRAPGRLAALGGLLAVALLPLAAAGEVAPAALAGACDAAAALWAYAALARARWA